MSFLVCTCKIFPETIPRSEFLDSKSMDVFNFTGHGWAVFFFLQVVVPLTFPPVVNVKFLLLHILDGSSYCQQLKNILLHMYVEYDILLKFYFIFLLLLMISNIVLYVYRPFTFSVKCLFTSFAYFSIDLLAIF